MFRIAVCDNDPEDLNRVDGMLTEYFAGHEEMEGKVRLFHDPRELVECMDKEAFDVFILDILMPEMNGMELGRRIRKKNTDAAIIFVTASAEYAVEAFEIYAFQYILKPVNAQKLEAALGKVWDFTHNQKRHMVAIVGSDSVTNIVAEDVAYIENDVRRAIYVMRDGQKVIGNRRTGTFEEAVSEVTARGPFIQTHKSFFLNMKYVRELRVEFAVMDDGMQIPINRKRFPAVKSRYMEYVSKGGD